MPSEEKLASLLSTEFKGSNKDYSGYIAILKALGIATGSRLLDYGCSWGYGAWQLEKRAGYVVQGFEISKPRCAFARSELKVNAVDSIDSIDPTFDCFFSAHVLEHLPDLSQVISLALSKLRAGGMFVAFTPNGSEINRQHDAWNWHRRWGFVHPQLLDERFCHHISWNGPRLVASQPFDTSAIAEWDQANSVELSVAGDELLLVLKKLS